MKDEPIFEKQAGFPAALEGELTCLSCLDADEHDAAFLCENAQGEKLILKTTDLPVHAHQLQNEKELLEVISRQSAPEAGAFPRAVDYRELPGDAPLWIFLRTHIPGHSIESLVDSQYAWPGLPAERAVHLLQQVLTILSFLHGLQPPVIHRDIKPQNLIVDEEGRVHLIDLGISRVQKEEAGTDTVIMGTRLTAPPEQFGYRSTDARSDIYSAGVLLRYCLTGEYTDSADETLPAPLRRIVRRATRFDPEERYQTAGAFLRDLKKWQRNRTPWTRACAVLLAAAVVLGGLLLARTLSAPGKTASNGPETTVFSEEDTSSESPETSVPAEGDTASSPDGSAYARAPVPAAYAGFLRTAEEMEKLAMENDLEDVAPVFLPQGVFFTPMSDYYEHCGQLSGDKQHVSKAQLRASLEMIRASSFWPWVRNIVFQNCYLESLEPFREYEVYHGSIYGLCLIFEHCTLPRDMSPLAPLAPILFDLQIPMTSRLACDTLDWLRGADEISVLDLCFVPGTNPDLSGIRDMTKLRILRLQNAAVDSDLLKWIGRRTGLEILSLMDCGIGDVSALSGLTRLEELNLRYNPVTDFSPVRDLPRLRIFETGNE